MRKFTWFLTLCLLCASYSPVAARGVYRVTLVLPNTDQGFWSELKRGVMDAARTEDVDILCPEPQTKSLDASIDSFEIAVAARVDGIIAAPMDTARYSLVLRRAQVAGVRVVLAEGDISASSRDCYAGTDNYAAGRAAGEDLALMTGGRAGVCVITSYSDAPGCAERVRGFTDAIAEYEDMRVIDIGESGDDPLRAMSLARQALIRHPQINAFFCASGSDLTGVCRAISEKTNAESYAIAGFDAKEAATAAVSAGLQVRAIEQSPYDMGREALKALMRILNGEEIASDSIYTPITNAGMGGIK